MFIAQSRCQVTVKGARHNNEDTSYAGPSFFEQLRESKHICADGKLFGVFDGHGTLAISSTLRI